MVDLSKATLTIPLGTVCGNGGYFTFTMEIQADGSGALYVYSNSGTSRLDEDCLKDLEQMVRKITGVIAELKGSNKLKKLELR